MSVRKKGQTYDGMKEACDRLQISKNTLLRYIKDEFLTEPDTIKQGKNKFVRIFTEQWYSVNEARLGITGQAEETSSGFPVDLSAGEPLNSLPPVDGDGSGESGENGVNNTHIVTKEPDGSTPDDESD